jgi:hypothetical protein
MDFRTAIERLGAAPSEDELAELTGFSPRTIRAAAAGTGAPPEDWERTLARVARERGHALLALADELDSGEIDPKWESAYG